jgi:hypothetical protein
MDGRSSGSDRADARPGRALGAQAPRPHRGGGRRPAHARRGALAAVPKGCASDRVSSALALAVLVPRRRSPRHRQKSPARRGLDRRSPAPRPPPAGRCAACAPIGAARPVPPGWLAGRRRDARRGGAPRPVMVPTAGCRHRENRQIRGDPPGRATRIAQDLESKGPADDPRTRLAKSCGSSPGSSGRPADLDRDLAVWAASRGDLRSARPGRRAAGGVARVAVAGALGPPPGRRERRRRPGRRRGPGGAHGELELAGPAADARRRSCQSSSRPQVRPMVPPAPRCRRRSKPRPE